MRIYRYTISEFALVTRVLRNRKARREHGGEYQLAFSSKGAGMTSKKGGVSPPYVIPWDRIRPVPLSRFNVFKGMRALADQPPWRPIHAIPED